MSATDHQPGDNVQLERGLEAASDQRYNQHTDIEYRLDAHAAQMAEGDARMTRIEQKLDGNNTATEEVLDILRLGKSFFRLAGYFGSFVKWATAIGAPVIVFYYTLKGGGKP